MAWVESHLKGGGGGVTPELVLESGQISDLSHYTTANFSKDISGYEFMFIKLYYDYNGTTSECYAAVDLTQLAVSSYNIQFQIRTPNIGIVTVTITKTAIAGYNYGGAWRNIYCDVKVANGLRSDIWQ